MSHYTQVLLMHAISSTHKTKGGWYKFQATLGYVKKGRKQGEVKGEKEKALAT